MRISDLFNIKRRFLRSAHLERDFRDPSALEGYVVTDQIQRSLDRIASGLLDTSVQRAWRVTGDYGCGKSSFALLIAHLFAGKEADLPPQLRKSLDLGSVKQVRRRLLPILITGSREALSVAVSRSLLRSLEEVFGGENRLALTPALSPRRGRGAGSPSAGRGLPASTGSGQRVQLIETLREALAPAKPRIADSQALSFILEANTELIARGKSDGILIILDELGKLLEFAALHPERQDIFFLQQLAETSTRSSREPLFTIGLLHQGFNAYADQLSQAAQKEWEKVAGRFEELLFDQPLHQIAKLIGSALNLSAQT